MKLFSLQISVLNSLLVFISATAQPKYALHIQSSDLDSNLIISRLRLQTEFSSRFACAEYIHKLPGLLQAKGYVTASVDSIRYDTSAAYIVLFVGEQYKWGTLIPRNIEPSLLEATGWQEKNFTGKPLNFEQVKQWQERLLYRLENTGYPFARVFLDSIHIEGDKVTALLKAEKGPLYTIDSIRIYGNAKISNYFLQRYLDIFNGSLYSREKLMQINKKIRELTYLEEEKPFDLSLLATGSVLNMYLRQKRSSQINALVGFLPNNEQLPSKKMLLTGEANVMLRNAFGAGESIGLNWQQIQVKSPRLNLLFSYPYLFRSALGLDFNFDILRKDSSFVNVNLQVGTLYAISTTQSGRIFFQRFQTIVSSGGINTLLVLQTRRLPDVGDVSSFNVGIDYEQNTTDYRFNPRKGAELRFITAIGRKKLKKNNEIISLKDPAEPSFNFNKLYDTLTLNTYQFRSRLSAAKYFPLPGNRSTLKAALNGGIFQSGSIFRNELFQVGGYKLLRGFDEESQYLSHFIVGTNEYRYLVGQNSYFYVLLDGGWGRNSVPGVKQNYTYVGTGLGMALETKAGIFNLAWAVGKRNDTRFNLRQSKLHVGFVNYF